MIREWKVLRIAFLEVNVKVLRGSAIPRGFQEVRRNIHSCDLRAGGCRGNSRIPCSTSNVENP